jgi:sugar phosphate isomerase/epimerase
MNKQYSLAHLTVLGCTPPEMTYIAARTGYDFVSLRLIAMGVAGEQIFSPADKAMISKTKVALEETGVKCLDLELARILADQDPKTYLAAMEAGAELGARHVIASAWTTDRSDFHFSRVGLDELAALPRQWLHFIHLCDTSEEIPTTRDGLIHVARNERLYVGEGSIDFAAILGRLPAIPLSIELPNARQVKELGFEGHARRCLETAKQYFHKIAPAQEI